MISRAIGYLSKWHATSVATLFATLSGANFVKVSRNLARACICQTGARPRLRIIRGDNVWRGARARALALPKIDYASFVALKTTFPSFFFFLFVLAASVHVHLFFLVATILTLIHTATDNCAPLLVFHTARQPLFVIYRSVMSIVYR